MLALATGYAEWLYFCALSQSDQELFDLFKHVLGTVTQELLDMILISDHDIWGTDAGYAFAQSAYGHLSDVPERVA